MASAETNSLSQQLEAVNAFPRVIAFARHFDECLKNDRDVSSKNALFGKDVPLACWYIHGVCSRITDIERRLIEASSQNWTKDYPDLRGNGVPEEIDGFLELLHWLKQEQGLTFPDFVGRTYNACAWMRQVKPVSQSEQRLLGLQKAIARIEFPSFSNRPRESSKVARAVQLFLLTYLNPQHGQQLQLPIPAADRMSLIKRLVSYVCSKLRSSWPPVELRRYKASLQGYIRGSIDSEASSFRRVWMLLTERDEALFKVLCS